MLGEYTTKHNHPPGYSTFETWREQQRSHSMTQAVEEVKGVSGFFGTRPTRVHPPDLPTHLAGKVIDGLSSHPGQVDELGGESIDNRITVLIEIATLRPDKSGLRSR